jgi:CubicO group peptidase (beta-lactamase class C family)
MRRPLALTCRAAHSPPGGRPAGPVAHSGDPREQVRPVDRPRADRTEDYVWYGSDQTLAEMIRRLRYLPPETSFRSQFAYNNVGYATAGLIAGLANRSSWEDLVRTRILGPLGMSETVLVGPELRGKSNVTRSHGDVDDTFRALPASSQQLADPIAPAGSMYSNVLDMAKWLRFLLDSGGWRGGGW